MREMTSRQRTMRPNPGLTPNFASACPFSGRDRDASVSLDIRKPPKKCIAAVYVHTIPKIVNGNQRLNNTLSCKRIILLYKPSSSSSKT